MAKKGIDFPPKESKEEIQSRFAAEYEAKRRAEAIKNATDVVVIESAATIEPPIIPNPEDAIDREHVQEVIGNKEGTPKENRNKFLDVMGRAKEMFGWYKSSGEHLVRRSKELDAQAEKMGMEDKFRQFGEWYNKRDWKTKLAVGLALGVGFGASMAAGASVPAAFGLIASGGGIVAQRTAGLMTMYLKFEKNVRVEDKWGKEKAMGKAIVYTAAMTGAMLGLSYAVKEFGESESFQRLKEWLGYKPGHQSTPAVEHTAPHQMAAVAVNEPPVVVPSAEAVISAPAVPEISVGATQGKGAEYMMKRVWEHMQDLKSQGLDPDTYADGSDARRLLEADASEINEIVHDIAKNPEHNFYHTDETSVRIDLDSKMTINADGMIELDGAVKAPEEDALVKPALNQEPVATSDANPASVTDKPSLGEVFPGVPIEQPPAPVEEILITPPHDTENILRDSSDNPVLDSDNNPIHTETPEQSQYVNQFGIEVPVSEAHIYADEGSKHLLVYGGSPLERGKVMLEYLLENPDKIIYSADSNGENRIPWRLVDGKAIPAGIPVRTPGFFGFFSDWMKAPSPDEFEKLIK